VVEHPSDQPSDGIRTRDGRPVPGKAAQPSGVWPRSAAGSKLEPFKAYLKERLQAGVWNGAVLLQEMRERNFSDGYTIFNQEPRTVSAAIFVIQRRARLSSLRRQPAYESPQFVRRSGMSKTAPSCSSKPSASAMNAPPLW